jgi:3-deoxy-D-manno-octulosonic-acid transferase
MDEDGSIVRASRIEKRIHRIWMSLPLWGIYLGSIVLAPVLLWMKFATYVRRRRPRDVAWVRWTLPEPTPDLPIPPESSGRPHVVFACMSYGEAAVARPVVRRLMESRPDVVFSLSICDPVSLKAVREAPWGWPLSHLPFDCILPVAKWLRRYHPDVIVFVDRISTKLLVAAAAEYGSRILLINGQPRNPKRFQYWVLAWLARWSYRGLRGVYMQHGEDSEIAKTYSWYGAEVRILGDLKCDMPPINIDPEKRAGLESWIGQAGAVPFVVAGSTEAGEDEKIVIEAYRLLRRDLDCRLLLAPRGMGRVPEILKLIDSAGLSVTRRTLGEGDADVYLLDTLGELAYAYSFGSAAWVGGFFDRGGHNVLEPLRWGVPFAVGTSYGHFKIIVRQCEEAGLGKRIRSAAELAEHWRHILSGGVDRDRIRSLATEIAEPHIGALERTVSAIASHLPPPMAAPEAAARIVHEGAVQTAPTIPQPH